MRSNQAFLSTMVSQVWTFKSHSKFVDERFAFADEKRKERKRRKKKKVKRKESSLSGRIKVDTCMFQAVPVACPVELMN